MNDDVSIILTPVLEELFGDKISFLPISTILFPSILFFEDEGIHCGYYIKSKYLTSTLRIWLKENVEYKTYITSSNQNCYDGINIFFTNPKDATKFIVVFGDKIQKIS